MKRFFSCRNLLAAMFIFCVQCLSAQENTRFLLRDEGISQIAYIDQANPKNNWYTPVPTGRDIQLVGDDRVMIGTGNGYEEHDILTGNKVFEITSFPGTISARRLRNGNTILVGANWQEKEGIVLVELDKVTHAITRKISYAGFNYVRLLRETVNGSFLITADDILFEADATKILWQAKIVNKDKPHAWQAQRLANGYTAVTGGYAASLQIFDKEGNLFGKITGPDEIKPNFFAGMQILSNGNYLVINWQGHGPNFGNSGTQLLEYTPAGKLAWSWKQDATKFSSLHGIILLDGLDTKYLHVEDVNGVLTAVK